MRHRRPRTSALRPGMERLDARLLLASLTPAQLTAAYGLNAVALTTSTGATVKGDGAGQTVAVVVAYHDAYLASDLQTFSTRFGLPAANLTQVNLAGAKSDDGWAGEEALDVQTIHSIAPAAKIVVVEAKSDNTSDMFAAVNVARNIPGVVAVSMSWGTSETSNERSYDAYFTTPAGHAGVAFIAASGDEGAAGGAEYPAASPNVIAVGGTSLYVGAGGAYAGELAWSGSSGGYSRYEPQPSYQAVLGASTRRSTPDVAFDGDPYTGVYSYSTAPSTGRGSWTIVGGTSVGAPAWAGIIAIADEGLALAGKGSLSSAAAVAALYNLPTSAYHAVTAANLGRAATTTTGLGSPVGATLIYDLVNGITRTATTPVATTPVVTTPTRPMRGRIRFRAEEAASSASAPIVDGLIAPVATQPATPIFGTGPAPGRRGPRGVAATFDAAIGAWEGLAFA